MLSYDQGPIEAKPQLQPTIVDAKFKFLWFYQPFLNKIAPQTNVAS